jgi:hypothetical protein
VLGGVARKLAGEFFTAINGQLGEPVPTAPATSAPLTAETGAVPEPASVASAAEVTAATRPTVFTRPAPAASAGGGVQVDVRNSLPAVALGAVIALLGVLVGWRLARRP